jgi:hypothetical protein
MYPKLVQKHSRAKRKKSKYNYFVAIVVAYPHFGPAKVLFGSIARQQ